MVTHTDDEVEKAERAIGSILLELESRMNGLVDAIEIQDIEVTTFSDVREQVARRVTIQLRTIPDRRWYRDS